MEQRIQMGIFLAIFPVLFFSGCGVEQETLDQEAVTALILAKERAALDIWSAGDPVGFSDNLSQQITYYDDIGASTRLDGIEEMKAYLQSLASKVKPHTYEIVDPNVQVLGNVAILTLRYHASTLDGQPLPPWKATSVYQFADGDWKVIHAHWSLVKE